ncbi:MAG: hypothetical protein K0S56_1589 [Microvirga sp.]|nr:hypothetical protein [Microvirga sp.]
MREFILLPVAPIVGTLALAIVMLTLPIAALMLWDGERRGYLRLGGFHRDDDPGF